MEERKERKGLKTLLILLAVVAAFALIIVIAGAGKDNSFTEKYAGKDIDTDVEGLERGGTYEGYLKTYADAARPQTGVEVDLASFTDGKDVELQSSYEGKSNVLVTGEESEVTFTFNVAETGLYNLELDYLLPLSKGVMAERMIYINGKLPFDNAQNVVFARIFTDAGEKRVDNQGNEIRAAQKEIVTWQDIKVKDKMGYFADPYCFYFEAGENTITIKGVNEPMAISKLALSPVTEYPTYEQYLATVSGNANNAPKDTYQLVEGENASARSESALYPKYDRSSPTTSPYSVTKTILNYIGGDAWKTAGQWIEWTIDVPADGFYNITVKGRQNYTRGGMSARILYIDGEVPFEEMTNVAFAFANDWECKQMADEDGNPYKFYLTEGKHTVRLEATLGDLGQILDRLENSVYRLNKMYRKILVYTGASPDKFRDYHIEKVYPDVMQGLELESMRLYKIVDDAVLLTGQKDDRIAAAQTLAQQLERFVEHPENIPVEFITFKDNITALGTAVLNISETKLDIDYLVVTEDGGEKVKDNANVFSKLSHEIRSWFASYVVDYNAVGDVYDEDEEDVVKVWVLSGRDQGTIVKTMIDDSFTPNSNVKVNVEIVDSGALLSAVVAGRGPNIVLSTGYDQPVNYALRHAVEDLTQFSDFWEVISPYTPSSYRQLELEGGIYGIPETESFNVMFYRTDVLEELGLEPPETWQDLIDTLPTIQGNNMSIGIPSATGSSNTTSSVSTASTAADLTMFFSLLYQYGGDLYNEKGTKTIVNSEAGVRAFEDYTEFFNYYGLPTVYDFVSRFRSGEMPIGIASYTTYNTLVVSAPEIRGLWDFTLIPGLEKTDENGETYVDHSAVIAGTASMMIKTEDEKLRNDSWEFLKWWAATDTQVRFGQEMEVLLGSSARYATANKEAFSKLAWSVADIKTLDEQWDWTIGIREVPGGYYTGQHITHAIRKVINDKSNARETIQDYTVTINDELRKKRKEFGMELE